MLESSLSGPRGHLIRKWLLSTLPSLTLQIEWWKFDALVWMALTRPSSVVIFRTWDHLILNGRCHGGRSEGRFTEVVQLISAAMSKLSHE